MPKNVPTTIRVFTDPSGKVEFEMKDGNNYTEIIVFNKTRDNIPKTDHYIVHFTIDDDTALGMQFDTANPMYLSKGNYKHVPKCPKNGNIGGTQGFSIVENLPNSLKVRNDDLDECFYKFVLNFRDSAGNPHQFDPIYGNQNGGRSVISSTTIGIAAGAAGGVAAMALGASLTPTSTLTGAAVGALAGVTAALILGSLTPKPLLVAPPA